MKKEHTVHSTKLSHWTSKTIGNGNETLFSKAPCWGCMSCKINCQNMSKSVLADWNPPPKGLRRSSVLPPRGWRHRMLSLLTGTNQGVEANPKFWGQTARFLFKKYPSPTRFFYKQASIKKSPNGRGNTFHRLCQNKDEISDFRTGWSLSQGLRRLFPLNITNKTGG